MYVHAQSMVHTKYGSFIAKDMFDSFESLPSRAVVSDKGHRTIVPINFKYDGEVTLPFPILAGKIQAPDLARAFGILTAHGAVTQISVVVYHQNRDRLMDFAVLLEHAVAKYAGKRLAVVDNEQYIEVTDIYNVLNKKFGFVINELPLTVISGTMETILSYIEPFLEQFQENINHWFLRLNSLSFAHYLSGLLLKCGIVTKISYDDSGIIIDKHNFSALSSLIKSKTGVYGDQIKMNIQTVDSTGYQFFVYLRDDMLSDFEAGNEIVAIDFIPRGVYDEAVRISQ